jgi:hypothetical protein
MFQGIPVFVEEGRYSEIETFNIPPNPKSIKIIKDDMASPELYLASSTNYEGIILRCYTTLLDATRPYSTLLDATRRYLTHRYSKLLDATQCLLTLLDATRRYSTLLDAALL